MNKLFANVKYYYTLIIFNTRYTHAFFKLLFKHCQTKGDRKNRNLLFYSVHVRLTYASIPESG